jgi:hypothetical protein
MWVTRLSELAVWANMFVLFMIFIAAFIGTRDLG